MVNVIKSIIVEMFAPSREDEPAYYFMVIAIAHALLGASFGALDVGGVAVAFRLAIPIVYWVVKERRDLRKGGGIRDGIIDALFVALGAQYVGPVWWPVTMLITSFVVAVLYVYTTQRKI